MTKDPLARIDLRGVVPRSPSWLMVERALLDNIKTFEFIANHLKCPFAPPLIRELAKTQTSTDVAWCFRLAVNAIEYGLRFARTERARLAWEGVRRFSGSEMTCESFDALNRAMSAFRRALYDNEVEVQRH